MLALLVLLLLVAPVWAQTPIQSDGVILLEEGATLGKAVRLNCVGAGIVCSLAGGTGTLTVGGGGGGGAPTDATYITQTPNATLTNEQALSALGTGLMLNTTGTGVVSIYAGTSCVNQFPRSLNASGVATCASVANTDLVNSSITVTGTANQVNVAGSPVSLGGAVTLSTPQNIHTGATPTFASMTLSADTNELVLGTTNPHTITRVAPAAPRTFTIAGLGDSVSVIPFSCTAPQLVQAIGTNGVVTCVNPGPYASPDAEYVVLALDPSLSSERVLTGTTNQITVTPAGSTVTLATPQNIHTAATPTFAAMTLSNNTNQLVLGTTNTTTLTMAALGASRVFTLPDADSNPVRPLSCGAGDFVNAIASTGIISCATPAGSGTVTTTGTPASGNLTQFSGATSITNGDLSGDVTTSGTLATTIAANAVTDGKFRQSGATSVVGRSANSAGNVADISTSTDGQVLRRAGATLGFGALDLSDADAITGDLPYANLTAASGASLLLGRGSAGGAGDWQEITLGTNLSMSGTTLNASGSGGAPADAQYWVSTANGTLSNETDLGALTTGLVLNTVSAGVGTPSAYAGTSCTNQFPRSLNASGAATCASVATADITDDAVTFAKMQEIATDRLIGRDTAATGNPEEITVGGGLEFTGSGGIQRSALTGDVTATAGSNSTTIANDAVTYAKMQNVSAASRILCRGSAGGAGDVEECTVSAPVTISGTAISSSFTASSSDTLTNKTYSAEDTGNSLTVPFKVWIPAAGCDNATAGTVFDRPTSNAPTAACYGTSPMRFGGLDHADGANALTSQVSVNLPSDWASGLATDIIFVWFSGSTSTNSAVWTVATKCIADTEDLLNPSFNATQTVADANNSTASTRNTASITSITMTGCAASETLFLRVGRDPTNGSDNLAATAVLLGIELTFRRTM